MEGCGAGGALAAATGEPPAARLGSSPCGEGGRAGEELARWGRRAARGSRCGREGAFPGGEAARLRAGVAFCCAPRGGFAEAGGGAAAPLPLQRGGGRPRSPPRVGRRSGRPLPGPGGLASLAAALERSPGLVALAFCGGCGCPPAGGSAVAVFLILPSRLACPP